MGNGDEQSLPVLGDFIDENKGKTWEKEDDDLSSSLIFLRC